MDMSFANQALSAEHLMKHAAELKPQVYSVPEPMDREIAQLKLESMGVQLDMLTAEQSTIWLRGTKARKRPQKRATKFAVIRSLKDKISGCWDGS